MTKNMPMPVSKLCLEEGELICDKCSRDDGRNIPTPFCPKCQGTGKVDWIENIVGKPLMDGSSSTSGPTGFFGMSGTSGWVAPAGFDRGSHDDAIDAMAKQLADDIDKEILESIMVEVEQINKTMKTAKTIMFEMEGS